jgi:hypothetical protein
LISGELESVRLPSRMVPVWVRAPTGLAPVRRAYSGYEGRRNGAQAGEHHAELALGGCDVVLLRFHEVSSLQTNAPSPGKGNQRLLPLRRDTSRARPVLDRALPLAEQGRQRALAAETTDDALCRVALLHGGLS